MAKNIVQVKAKHIKEAKRLREECPYGYLLSRCCPVALATQEHLGHKAISASGDSIIVWADTHLWNELLIKKFKVSKTVYAAIMTFDNRESLKPFNFRLTEIE